MDSGRDQAGLMTGVVEPGLDLVAEAEYGLLGLAGARALLTSILEHSEELSRELQTSRQTNEKELDLTKEELKEMLDNLGPYSNIINVNGKNLLIFFMKQFQKGYTWVQTTVTTMSKAIIFLNIIRYFYNNLVLPILKKPLKEEGLHIVLVGKGSFNDKVHPADWLIPGSCITDTILYSPWNCCIDARVAYSIATGDLQPQNRDFINNQAPIMQEQVPDHWNSIRDQDQPTDVPEIILGPLNGDDDLITKIMALADWMNLYRNSNRVIIQYSPGDDLAEWLPEIPLYQIIGVIKFLLMLIPPHKATIHLAADLKYRGATQPDVARLNHQYAYTPDGTVMTTQTIEFPMIYALFQFLFGQAPPQ